jgi:hypothetical protein
MMWASTWSLIVADGPVQLGRPIFEFFSPILEVTFYTLAAISTLVFALGVFLKVRLYHPVSGDGHPCAGLRPHSPYQCQLAVLSR